MQHADREDQVEDALGQRQVEQVGLDDHDVGQLGAERGGLVDGRAQVDADDPGAVAAEQPGIAAAAAAGVEHELAGKRRPGATPGLDLKRRLVFLGAGHVVTVPLPAEAGGVRVAGQPRNAADDRVACAARRAVERLGRIADDLQRAPASRAQRAARAVRDS